MLSSSKTTLRKVEGGSRYKLINTLNPEVFQNNIYKHNSLPHRTHTNFLLDLRCSRGWIWRILPSVMWCSIVWQKFTDVSDERFHHLHSRSVGQVTTTRQAGNRGFRFFAWFIGPLFGRENGESTPLNACKLLHGNISAHIRYPLHTVSL